MPSSSPTSAWSRLAWSAAAGVAWGMAVPDLRGGILVLLGGACMARAVSGRLGGDLTRGLIASVCWQLLALDWVPIALADYGVDDARAAGLALVVAQSLPLLLPWVLASVLVRRQVPVPLALGLAWVCATEPLAWAQTFPMSPAALLAGSGMYLWPAAVGGAPLLSGIAVGVGAASPSAPGLLALGLWTLVAGQWIDQPEPHHTVRVGIVQPDVGAFDGRRTSTADARAERLVDLIQQAEQAGATFVVTPESAWPHDPTRRPPPPGLLPVVLGLTHPDGPTNSLAVWQDGRWADRFDKKLRVPLSERRVAGMGQEAFVAGTRPRLLTVHAVRLAPLICFEDLHPSALRDAVQHQPHALLAAANDAWSGDSVASRWHLAQARLAAVATRRPVLRPTISGHSAYLDTAGRLHAWTPWVDGDRIDSPGLVRVVDMALAAPRWSGVQVAPWLTVFAWCLGMGLAWRCPQRTKPPEGGSGA